MKNCGNISWPEASSTLMSFHMANILFSPSRKMEVAYVKVLLPPLSFSVERLRPVSHACWTCAVTEPHPALESFTSLPFKWFLVAGIGKICSAKFNLRIMTNIIYAPKCMEKGNSKFWIFLLYRREAKLFYLANTEILKQYLSLLLLSC